MKKTTWSLWLMAAILFTACSSDSNDGGNGDQEVILPELSPARSLAFPGADGSARNIKGGAGGDVYVVTTLEDNAAGSLRQGLASSNRTIVFAVAGQINLKSNLNIEKSNITIAGQTAPGDGITIAGYPVFISGNNIILRFLRFRMGDQNIDQPSFVADDGDALGSKGSSNVLIDHCSISYSTDECASFSKVTNLTLQYSIISESMKLAGHSKGNHGYGGIWGGKNASYHHNLLADHSNRTPRFDHYYVGQASHGPIDYINNVVYNWSGNGCYGGEANTTDNQFHINIQNNYYKPGPATTAPDRLLQITSMCGNCCDKAGTNVSRPTYPECVVGKFYISGNTVNGVANKDWDGVGTSRKTTHKGTSYTDSRTDEQIKEQAKLNSRYTTGFTALNFMESADNAYNTVLNCAGASYKRDAVDLRIISQVKNNQGVLIDKVSDNMAFYFPTLAQGAVPVDSDNDGMPDSWEAEQLTALGYADASVSSLKPNAYNLSEKYTNLEIYLNSLVMGTFPAGANATVIK